MIRVNRFPHRFTISTFHGKCFVPNGTELEATEAEALIDGAIMDEALTAEAEVETEAEALTAEALVSGALAVEVLIRGVLTGAACADKGFSLPLVDRVILSNPTRSYDLE